MHYNIFISIKSCNRYQSASSQGSPISLASCILRAPTVSISAKTASRTFCSESLDKRDTWGRLWWSRRWWPRTCRGSAGWSRWPASLLSQKYLARGRWWGARRLFCRWWAASARAARAPAKVPRLPSAAAQSSPNSYSVIPTNLHRQLPHPLVLMLQVHSQRLHAWRAVVPHLLPQQLRRHYHKLATLFLRLREIVLQQLRHRVSEILNLVQELLREAPKQPLQ